MMTARRHRSYRIGGRGERCGAVALVAHAVCRRYLGKAALDVVRAPVGQIVRRRVIGRVAVELRRGLVGREAARWPLNARL